MDQSRLHRWIVESFDGVATQEAHGYTFYFFGEDRKLPFVTIAHPQNAWEKVSDLDRPGVYRLNIGVRPETYRALFGPQPPKAGASGVVETGHDFTALDQVMPHPHYATQSWLCVLSPSADTFACLQPLVREAYDLAVARDAKRSP
jgi:hypothetical protein